MKKTILIITMFLCVISFVSVKGMGNISAQSAVLIEQSTDTVVFSKNSDKKMKPASTTKILTAICALEYGNLDDVVTVSKNAADQEGSSMYIEEGETITLENLLYGLMLNSGNDAAVAIAEHISGNTAEFAKLMNKKAVEIGAKNCNFVTPNGLDDDNHYVTAKDLALITSYALDNEKFREIVKTKTKVVTTEEGVKKYLTNHNKMLNMYNGCIGVKTGFTKASGRTLVTASEKDGIIFVAVTLNAPDDWNDHVKMLNFGHENASRTMIINTTDVIGVASVIGGKSESVPLKCDKEYIGIKINGINNKYEVNYNINKLNAPVIANQKAGTATVLRNGVKVFETDLKTVKAVEKIKIIEEKNTFFKIFKRFCELW